MAVRRKVVDGCDAVGWNHQKRISNQMELDEGHFHVHRPLSHEDDGMVDVAVCFVKDNVGA